MTAIWPILLLGVAGLLVGGFVSLRQQGARWPVLGFVAGLAVLSAAGGVLWMMS